MKDIGELLRETDPLRFESNSEQKLQRQALLRVASITGVEALPRSRVSAFAIMAIVLVALVSWIGVQSLFINVVQAAVRFEVRLAEDNPRAETD